MVLTKCISSCWTLEFSINANKDLHKLEKPIKQRISDYFKENVLKNHNPRTKGKPLSGKLAGHWSYRIGNYRVLTHIQDEKMVILAVSIGHRREIYK